MERFPQFRALPPELRRKIWDHALLLPSVWAGTRDTTAGLSMAFLGPPPYTAGCASYESRQVLRQLYGDPLVGLQQTIGSVHWVHLDNTLVYLRDFADVSKVLETFPAEELKRIRHVALGFASYAAIKLICQQLAASCPALRTFIVFWDPVANPPAHALTPAAAATLTTYLDYTGPYQDSDGLDVGYFRSLLLPLFGDCQPRLHVVTHSQAHRLELLNNQS